MTYVRWRVIILSVRLQIIGIFSQVTCAPLISNHGSMDVGRKRSGSHGFRAVCARVASVALWYVNCTWSTRKSAGIPLDEPFFSQREIFVIVCVGLCDHYLESREKHDWVWYFTFVSLKGKKYLICKSKKKNQFIIFKQYGVLRLFFAHCKKFSHYDPPSPQKIPKNKKNPNGWNITSWSECKVWDLTQTYTGTENSLCTCLILVMEFISK